MKRIFVPLLACYVLFSGCGHQDAKFGDLPGVWTLNESSFTFLPSQYKRMFPTLFLDSIGKFEISDLPASAIGEIHSLKDVPITGSGRWKVREGDVGQEFELSFTNLSPESIAVAPFTCYLPIEWRNRRFEICFYHGDPDGSAPIYLFRRLDN